MGNRLGRSWTGVFVPMLGLLLALLISLYVLSNATENTTRFSNQYGWLILFNLYVLSSASNKPSIGTNTPVQLRPTRFPIQTTHWPAAILN